jgi:hypothetical protein
MQNWVPFMAKRAFDFSGFSGGVSSNLVLVRALDVLSWRAGDLLVPVHSLTTPGGNARLRLRALPTSPSPDAPDVDFTLSSASAEATLETASAGALVKVTLSGALGSHLQLVLRVTAPASAGTFTANLSAALVMREQP